MNIVNPKIDKGNPFDFGRTAEDYARFRDIYPKEFYERITKRGHCLKGQNVLDLGTGTGVVPRNMYQYGAKWTGVDISANQIEQAKVLSKDMNIDYCISAVENMDFSDGTFDVITACQCFWYFNHEKVVPTLYRILKPHGKFIVMCMEWLPFEDEIAAASEALVLKYNPQWSGAGSTMNPIFIPECYSEKFDIVYHEEFYVEVPFTRESWNGRMKSCRGIGASLSTEEISKWESEHLKLLNETAPKKFKVLHYCAFSELEKK